MYVFIYTSDGAAARFIRHACIPFFLITFISTVFHCWGGYLRILQLINTAGEKKHSHENQRIDEAYINTADWCTYKNNQNTRPSEELTEAPWYTRSGLRCLERVSIPCRPVITALSIISRPVFNRVTYRQNWCAKILLGNLYFIRLLQLSWG
jgi:hypothetical protein